MKKCLKCGQTKKLEDFYIKNGKPTSPCKECVRSSVLKNYHANPLPKRKRMLEWALNNNDKVRQISKKVRLRLKILVVEKYGGKCACCGEKELVFLAIDHIKNDGAAHRREIGNGQIHRWLKRNNFPAGFQVLCFNCNAAKHILGRCPHK